MDLKSSPSALPFCSGSRRRAAFLALGSMVFAFGGWLLTNAEGTPRTPASIQHAIGWVTVLFCGAMGIAWLISFFIPARLWVDNEGFSFKQAWRKKACYGWDEIDRFWLLHQRGSRMVVWTNKRSTGGVTKAVFGCDGWLPGGWVISAEELENALTAKKESYDAAKRNGS